MIDDEKNYRKDKAMRQRTIFSGTVESRLMDTEELQAYTNLGRNSAMKLGEKTGAKVKIGKRVLWDRIKIDQYLDRLTEVEKGRR